MCVVDVYVDVDVVNIEILFNWFSELWIRIYLFRYGNN